MKKLLGITFLGLFISWNANAGDYGEGHLQLSKQTVEHFIKHIRSEGGKKPADFYVTLDGSDAIYWTCASGQACMHGDPVADIKRCLEVTGKKCKKFARIRTVRWKNGINPGKGKESKINSKASDFEIKQRLKELGFID